MRKWIKVFFFLPVIWIIFGAGVCAKEEGPGYMVTVIQDNNKPMLFETGTELTKEMLPGKLTVRAERLDEGKRPILLELPVTWNLDAFREEMSGSCDFALTGILNLPPGYETAADVEEPKIQILYRDRGPIKDLMGRYRGGAVTLWFNRLTEEFPYYGKIPDADRVWMEYSKDGNNWEREEIVKQEASYLAEKIFDGSPVMIRLYVESGMQAGYSNTIWLPYELGSTDSNGSGGEGSSNQSGDTNGNEDDGIGGNRGGGSAVLPQYQPTEEETVTKGDVDGGAADNRISGSTNAYGEGTDISGAPDKKQSYTPADASAVSGETSSRDSGSSASSDAVSGKDSDTALYSDKDTGVPLRTWLAGISILLLCIASGAGIMKLIGYYKR